MPVVLRAMRFLSVPRRPALSTFVVVAVFVFAGCGHTGRANEGRSFPSSPSRKMQSDLPAPTKAKRVQPGNDCLEHYSRPILETASPPADLDKLLMSPSVDNEGRFKQQDAASHHEAVASPYGAYTFSSMGPLSVSRNFDIALTFPSGAGRRGVLLAGSKVGLLELRGQLNLRDKLSAELKWVTDLDGDGISEIVIPETAWVGAGRGFGIVTVSAYNRIGDNFVLNIGATEIMREKLANLYEGEITASQRTASTSELYRFAAEHLRTQICSQVE